MDVREYDADRGGEVGVGEQDEGLVIIVKASSLASQHRFIGAITTMLSSNRPRTIVAVYGPTADRKTLRNWITHLLDEDVELMPGLPDDILEHLGMRRAVTRNSVVMDERGMTAAMFMTARAAAQQQASPPPIQPPMAQPVINVDDDDDNVMEDEVGEMPTLDDVSGTITNALRLAIIDTAHGTTLLDLAMQTFDYERGMESFYNVLVTGESAHMTQRLFGGGKMQSRKTVQIVVFYMVAYMLDVVVLSINHYIKCRTNLFNNMEGDLSMPEDQRPEGYLQAIRKADPVNFKDLRCTTYTGTKNFFLNDLKSIKRNRRGIISIANTTNQLDNAKTIILDINTRYTIVMDEADALKRKKITKMAAAMASLLTTGVLLATFSVTGTLLPKLAAVATDKYCGYDMFRPLNDPATGKKVFLMPRELQKDDFYFNDKVKIMVDSLIATPMGIMPFMVTGSVNVPGNMRDVADNIMNKPEYRNKLAAIVSTGGETIRARFVDDPDWHTLKKSSLQHAIKEVERKAMSFRSDDRVPTHAIVSIGMGHTMEAVAQALSRACGYCKPQLQANRVDHITILTLPIDYDTTIACDVFMNELRDKLDAGMTLAQAWSDEYSALASIFMGRGDTPSRKVGLGEDMGPRMRDMISFEKLTRRQRLQMPGLQYLRDMEAAAKAAARAAKAAEDASYDEEDDYDGEDFDEYGDDEAGELGDAAEGESEEESSGYAGARTLARLFRQADPYYYIDQDEYAGAIPHGDKYVEGYVLDRNGQGIGCMTRI
ncbi:hypothetical protein JKP88DRAFT_301243 [Tribonema minus]|uniref:Uncharacterized protein n=1 Tax=Tribonema minus TaxID=303371 RepID=A0A836CKB0_9STRA|nr:hypothetical protein JKP88DRAFT_301243 [Tribonema minus]